LPLPGDPPLPGKYGLQTGQTAEIYYKLLPAPPASQHDCGSGAHGERRPWELPSDEARDGGTPGVDRLKAEFVRREVARQIEETGKYAGDVPQSWRRWARMTLAPKVDYMATIRHVVRRALRGSTLGRHDRT
jgi:hypothetical protein